MNQNELDRYTKAISVKRNPDLTLNPYRFKGYGNYDSECKVMIWHNKDYHLVVFVDLGKGTSVTNASEQLVTEIYKKHLIIYDKKECMFVETYDNIQYDAISPTWQDDKVLNVNWFHLGKIVSNK